jgi:hypothetical protein
MQVQLPNKQTKCGLKSAPTHRLTKDEASWSNKQDSLAGEQAALASLAAQLAELNQDEMDAKV